MRLNIAVLHVTCAAALWHTTATGFPLQGVQMSARLADNAMRGVLRNERMRRHPGEIRVFRDAREGVRIGRGATVDGRETVRMRQEDAGRSWALRLHQQFLNEPADADGHHRTMLEVEVPGYAPPPRRREDGQANPHPNNLVMRRTTPLLPQDLQW